MGESEWTVRVTAHTTINGRVPMLGADPRRVALLFSVAGGLASARISAVGWGTALPEFPGVATGYLAFQYCDFGPLPAGAWDLVSSVAGTTCWTTEILTLEK